MRKIIVHEFITLDGVIQAPGGKEEDTEGGFEHGGWTRHYWHGEIGENFGKVMQDADTFLLGRKTWEIHGAAFDPMPEGDPFGDIMKNIKKVVVSTTLENTDLWRNSTLIKENVVEEIQTLKAGEGKNILVDGSSVLLQTLIQNDLIDEYQLHVYPLVLGKGKRLFQQDKKIELSLVESKTLPTGVIFIKYQPVK